MNKQITYPIKVIKDIREDLKDIIGKNINCCISFDKWNNLILIEVFGENEITELIEKNKEYRKDVEYLSEEITKVRGKYCDLRKKFEDLK